MSSPPREDTGAVRKPSCAYGEMRIYENCLIRTLKRAARPRLYCAEICPDKHTPLPTYRSQLFDIRVTITGAVSRAHPRPAARAPLAREPPFLSTARARRGGRGGGAGGAGAQPAATVSCLPSTSAHVRAPQFAQSADRRAPRGAHAVRPRALR